jgi:hypothetical protein
MTISSVSSFLNAMTPGGAAIGRQVSTRSDPMADTMREIREKGLSAWAHQQRIDALKEKLRAQILSERHLDEKSLNAMGSEQRASVEDEISKLIEQKLKEAMERAAEDGARGGKAQGVLLNIMA